MSQAGITSLGGAGAVTSVTGNDGITTSPSTGDVQVFAKATGTRNIWLGEGAGNNSISGTAQNNTSLGYHTLNALTDGASNTGIGSNTLPVVTIGGTNTGLGAAALNKLTTGASNTAVGKSALDNLVSGTTNVCVGISAGSVYTTNESNNICLGANTGVIGDSATIRIGVIQSTCYVAGIYATTPGVAGARVNVTDSNGQVGTLGAGTNGQVLVGSTGANPVFATIGSSDSSITATLGAGTLTLQTNKATANAYTGQQNFAEVALTDASPITWNLNTQQAARVLLTAAVGATRQLQNPTNMVAGGTYTLRVTQSATGSNALTYGAAYKWPGGSAPVLSTANNAIDILTFTCDGTSMYGVAQLGFA